MRYPLFAALVVLSLVLVASAPAAAQSVGTPTASTPTGPQPTANDTEAIDNQTTIISSRLETENNQTTAYITLRSDIVQTVTLSDATAFRAGGEVPVRTIVLGAGETATVEIPIRYGEGWVGVSISTENTALYAEVLQRSGGTSGGLDALRAVAPLTAWILGILIAFVWMTIAGWSVLRSEDKRPEVA